MADSKDTAGAASAAPTPAPAPLTADAAVGTQSLALAQAAVLAKEQHVDDGDEGGHYVVNGVDVNAYGKPIKQGKDGKWELVNPDDARDMRG